MPARRRRGPESHKFRNKLLLNQWLISLFGVDPFREHRVNGRQIRPFHLLAAPIRDARMEGVDQDGLHQFFHNLVNSELFWNEHHQLSREQILDYEENIVRYTQAINHKREQDRPVVWKYFQWLTLLFTEIYLDRYFHDPEGLLASLNEFVTRFNQHWSSYAPVALFTADDLNKLCLQNATGSGKTLLMHVNVLQYRHYAKQTGKDRELSRVILLTPNDRLSEQHITEFRASGVSADSYTRSRDGLFGTVKGLEHVDVMEITSLAEKDGPNTIAARSLGDQNLLLVDEGHRGMSGKEEGVWFSRRSALCAKGFTFEYSATFEQAVAAAGRSDFEDSYAKSVLFDYSYRWFYEDGFGKDYQILNLPTSHQENQAVYLTACLLKFYQQMRIYQEKTAEFRDFNIEKPLWVFVGSTVSKAKGSTDEKAVAADVALIIQFLADLLAKPQDFQRRIGQILTGTGQDTGLLDKDGNDIFKGAFTYLARGMNAGETVEQLYRDILKRVFNCPGGGQLHLSRVKGDSGEVVLTVGTAEEPFGLINVGDAKGLCDHVEEVARQQETQLTVADSDFTEAMFSSVKDSASPVNVLIGSKRFVEGWDCWRVSTMGLMHVGKSEGTQIIQLFGRGVRLKGFRWCLKRSGHSFAPHAPLDIEELETLNVFGIEADFMERFREFLRDEGLPGNERRRIITIPLNVTHDFGKRLKIIRPKLKAGNGREYDFKRDARVPTVGEIPDYLTHNTVVSDWYPRIQSVASRQRNSVGSKDRVILREENLSFLDFDALFFEVEAFKRERSWHNLNVSTAGIRRLLQDSTWYTLYLPETRLKPTSFAGVRLIQQIATELVKRYCDRYYNYRKREYIEPRLEIRDLTKSDDLIPRDEEYQLVVDGDAEQVIQSIQQVKAQLETEKDKLLQVGDLHACNFSKHLFQPLFHVRRGGKITILPVALNESEYQFVEDLKTWSETNESRFEDGNLELFLLRNLSRGRGIGFFEAANFHPDFILWMISGQKQYVTFIEPHGLLHEGPESEKVQFAQTVKQLESRLGDPDVVLNSFILSWTKYPQLHWGPLRQELEGQHILFMTDDRDNYIEKMFRMVTVSSFH